jgi:hypothetical protein
VTWLSLVPLGAALVPLIGAFYVLFDRVRRLEDAEKRRNGKAEGALAETVERIDREVNEKPDGLRGRLHKLENNFAGLRTYQEMRERGFFKEQE